MEGRACVVFSKGFAEKRDGMLALRNGEIVLTPPAGGGRPPTLVPGANVRVFVNGNEITDPCMINETDEVVLEPVPKEPTSEFSISVSPDGMSATAALKRSPGGSYRLPSLEPQRELRVYGVPDKIEPPPPLTREDVDAALREAGITFGVIEEAVQRLLQADDRADLQIEIARGRKPEDPQDGRIEMIQLEEAGVDETATRVDLLERLQILTVERGEMIARLHEPVPGKDGIDVLGKPIPARPPVPVKMTVGKGARLSEDGRTVVAEIAGQPSLNGTTVSVQPVLEFKNVDVQVGHIDFDGDVIVRGNVSDQIRIRAGGKITIFGGAGRADLRANEGVVIKKQAVGTSIDAGGDAATAGHLFSVLGRFREQLKALMAGYKQLMEAMAGAKRQFAPGHLIKTLLERRFSDIESDIDEAIRLTRDLEGRVEVTIMQTVMKARAYLTGRGPLEMEDDQKLVELQGLVDKALGHLEALAEQTASVEIGYAQNAAIRCSGSVTITGKACYHSTIEAGTDIKGPICVIRGGRVTSHNGNIEVREMGSPQGAPTQARVGSEGRIRAQRVHPNVVCFVGTRSIRFNDPTVEVNIRLNEDGEIVKS